MFIKIKTSIRPLILKRKFKIWAYYHLLLTGLLLSMFSAMAADDTLKAFQASYDLFKNERLVGETILQVEKSDDRLSWQMTTRPSGLYAFITNKQPHSESILIRLTMSLLELLSATAVITLEKVLLSLLQKVENKGMV